MKKVPIGSKPQPRSHAPSADAWVDQANAQPTQPIAVEPVEPIKRLTIEVPLSLHLRTKLRCVERGVTMADVIRELLEGYVSGTR